MSRVTVNNAQYELSYGRDHECGLFVQVFDRYGNDDDFPLIDLDCEHNLTVEEIIDIAETYGFALQASDIPTDI